MKTLDINSDNLLWALVPLDYPVGPLRTQDEWADAVADAFSVGTTDAGAIKESLRRYGRAILIEPQPGLYRALWYMRDPFRVPLIARVYADADAGDDTVSLSEMAGAYEAGAARPPVVDELPSEVFGSIARVIRFSKDEHLGQLIMRITLVGRHDGALVMIDAVTRDLDYGTLAIDDLAALMESCVFGDDGSGD